MSEIPTGKPAGDKFLRQIILTTIMLCFALLLPQEAMAKGKAKQENSENPKYASLIIDAETGQTISERYADKTVHPASLTKVMTLLLLFDALEAGNVRLNDKIQISQNAANQQPSKLGLPPGSSIRVEDAILAVVTKSANDIATAIAEHLDGTEARFAQRMTRRAHDIGMVRSNFRNAHGLHNPQQVTTARDMATLARYVLIRYPNYYRYFGTKQFTYRGKTHTNHNRLMNTYPGMDGFKTGFINASGFNLIASAKHDGRRLIGVVFGGRSWKSRNDHMESLLNAGFSKASVTRNAQAPTQSQERVVQAPAAPIPAPKPVFRTTEGVPSTSQGNYTSLAALGEGRKVVAGQYLQAPQDSSEKAAADVRTAVNRGDYSELTGEGDSDAITARRVEAGLLAAAVYKGEHEKVRQLQLASATQATGNPAQDLVQQFAQEQGTEPSAVTPVALPPVETPAMSDLWSVQIGAYTSRVATDDALRIAQKKLPSQLSNASPIVVPLKTSEGILFRARLGGFSQAQAVEACRYFRDCLPIAPR